MLSLPILPPLAVEAVEAVDQRSGRGLQEIRRKARTFEAALMQMLVHQMRRSGLEEGFFGEGITSDTYGWMMDRNLGQVLAKGMSLGLADTMVEQLAGRRHGRVDGGPAVPESSGDRVKNGLDSVHPAAFSRKPSRIETVPVQDPDFSADKKIDHAGPAGLGGASGGSS